MPIRIDNKLEIYLYFKTMNLNRNLRALGFRSIRERSLRVLGFSVVEVMVAVGLLSILVMNAFSVFGYLASAKNTSGSRATQLQLQSQIKQLLAAPADCIKNLVDSTNTTTAASSVFFTDTQTFDLYENRLAGDKIFTSGKASQSASISLKIRLVDEIEKLQVGTERPVASTRYLAELVLIKTGIAGSSSSQYSESKVPILLDLKTSDSTMIGCTTRPENIEDSLYAIAGVAANSIRDCYKVGGTPYPIALGLICRVPLPSMNTVSGDTAVQSALICPDGWTVARNTAGVAYTTTMIRDLSLAKPQCPNGPHKCKTAWHSMNALDPGTESCRVYGDKAQYVKSGSFPILGATIVGFAVYAYILNMPFLAAGLAGTAFGTALTSIGAALVTNPIGWAILGVILIFAIFSVSKKKKNPCAAALFVVQKSQPTAIGCY